MSQPSVPRHHADWLSLVEVSGPFVSLPVLLRIFPQGLEARDPLQAKALRAVYQEWQDTPNAPGMQRAWVLHVLSQLLGYLQDLITEGQAIPAGLETNLPEMAETLRPDFAIIAPAGTDNAAQAQLLIVNYPNGQLLDKPVIGRHWKATPATRMMELLHGAGVSLGMVTNGEHWMLVYAPRGEITGYASWYANLWLDEPITLRAFHSLLGVRRFFGVAADSTLLAMFKESAQDQQEVTDQLGYQVREAVEVLVLSFDALDKENNRSLLQGVSAKTQYEAALTIMMRLVFLFSAEERGLLQLGKPLYDENYAVSTLQEQLQEVADHYGEEVLERRYDAWTRLLATFRAVHGGVDHQDMMMQAYGGSLFDPDRYPFLEGRAVGSNWRNTLSEPLAVNNRVVLHLLNSLQRLRSKTDGMTETRRVSFRALGVEQIGHVYEGLLDHTAVRATEPVLGIQGTRKKSPEIPLSVLEGKLAEDKLITFLKDETGRSASALQRALNQDKLLEEHKLLIACGQDETLLARVRPFAGLIRNDSFERPLIVLTNSVYVTAGTARRNTGSHYTPPSLTEPIVKHTLEPLVYTGIAQGLPPEQWQLKSPKDILGLKVCDMAMGSGAFLVQACRYLAERLVEAWENAEQQHPHEILITPDGEFSKAAPSERLIPTDAAERIAIARRVIADRCLYGVDINPMAVEMAKLSLWLITVDKSRPFTFLDHSFKCGDSLLGIHSAQQLDWFYIDPKTQQTRLSEHNRVFAKLIELRDRLETLPSETARDIEHKAILFEEVEEQARQVRTLADVLIGSQLHYRTVKQQDDYLHLASNLDLGGLEADAHRFLQQRKPLHWALEYPEVFAAGGFNALIGNPPFVGGQKITGIMGTDYRDWLVAHLANGQKGSADLCAYFFLQAGRLLRAEGMAGLIATNTIAQGGTREVGLDQLTANSISIPRAIPSTPWIGAAALEVAHVWIYNGVWAGSFTLNDVAVSGITAFLTPPSRTLGNPYRLKSNEDKSFIGSYVLGIGFVLESEQAAALIAQNPKNRDCLFPYLNGEDLNSRPDQTPSRWVINFHNFPLNREAEGVWQTADEEQRKLWLRAGRVPFDYPESVAEDYSDLLAIIEERVKPEREKLRDTPDGIRLKQIWWQFARTRPELYETIAGMERVMTRSRVGNMHSITFAQTNIVLNERLTLITLDSHNSFSLLQSNIHELWSREFSGTLKADMMYSPSDCFENFPFPKNIEGVDRVSDSVTRQSEAVHASGDSHANPTDDDNVLENIGARYYQHRQTIMQTRGEGLTKTYNRFHNPNEIAADIEELRRLHTEMDNAVAAAYGWQDLDLAHGFHDTKQGIRFTLSETARREVLDRLLELNHQRYAEEVEAGLHDKKAKKTATKPRSRKPKTASAPANEPEQFKLF